MSRKRSAAIARLTPLVKRVDWVGRAEDITTVAKWIWHGAQAAVTIGGVVWGWIVGSPALGLLMGLGAALVVGLFGPMVVEVFREAHVWRRAERRRLTGWGDILPGMERLAESLQRERRDRQGEEIVLLNRNRMALAKVAGKLDERDIPHPEPSPSHGDTEVWETFLWGFIRRVNDSQAATLPTLYQDVLKAYEDREYWKDGANLLRHFQRTENHV
ncbi:MAG: hypothetical protein F4X60_07840 [Gemmatimonadetes bacterium]|nr:hypothetical protein [Gemmatimonadota bacterium]MYB98450.1 hypothetical protein [Gemmatimonadota bacterium]